MLLIQDTRSESKRRDRNGKGWHTIYQELQKTPKWVGLARPLRSE